MTTIQSAGTEPTAGRPAMEAVSGRRRARHRLARDGTDQRAEVLDESFGGIGLLLRNQRPQVGSRAALQRSLDAGLVRVSVLGRRRYRVGCEWQPKTTGRRGCPRCRRSFAAGSVWSRPSMTNKTGRDCVASSVACAVRHATWHALRRSGSRAFLAALAGPQAAGL